MEQIARNLTDREEGFLTGKRFLIIDRDAIFSPKFKSILRDSGVVILLTAYQAPNMNAYAERFVRSIKSECLAGEKPARAVTAPGARGYGVAVRTVAGLSSDRSRRSASRGTDRWGRPRAPLHLSGASARTGHRRCRRPRCSAALASHGRLPRRCQDRRVPR